MMRIEMRDRMSKWWMMILISMLLTGCTSQAIKLDDEKFLECVDGDTVDFSMFFPTDWDIVWIFHPYTPLEKVEETIGTRFKYETAIEYSDTIHLVIALKDDHVVSYAEISRLVYDFNTAETLKITKENQLQIN